MFSVIAAAVIPLLLMVIFSVVNFSESKRSSTLRSISLLLDKESTQLSSYFSHRKNEIATFTEIHEIQSMNFSKMRPFLIQQLQRLQPHYEKFIIGKPSGHFYNTSGGNPHQKLLRTFNDALPDAKPKSIHKRDYWQITLGKNTSNTNTTYVSEPMISYTTEVKQIVVASSIFQKGKLAGMLGGALPWDNIQNQINRILERIKHQIGDSRIFLLSPNGNYWYHWDPNLVVHYKKSPDGNTQLNQIGEKSIIRPSILQDYDYDFANHANSILNTASGAILLKADSQQKSHYLFHHKLESNGYVLGLLVPESIVSKPVLKIRNFLALLAVAAIALLVVASYGVGLHISRPIQILSSMMGSIRQGESIKKFTPKGQDEIAQLTHDIFSMLDSLKEKEHAKLSSEEQLRKLNEDLEFRIMERTRELDQRYKELDNVKQEAIRANNAKSLFLANMAHELRTPLNSIMGFTVRSKKYLAQKQYAKVSESMDIVDRNGSYLLALINQILDISKIESGKIELQPTPYLLHKVLTDCINSSSELAYKKGLEIRTDIQWKGSINIDMIKIKQVILNLLSNAIKFTNTGYVRCSLFTQKEGDEEYAFLSIQDTGIGIKQKDMDIIFNKFTQLPDANQSRITSGTGLGLAISNKIIEMHNGTIELESEFGEGSCFTIKLPLNP